MTVHEYFERHLKNFLQSSSGDTYALAVNDDGSVKVWGWYVIKDSSAEFQRVANIRYAMHGPFQELKMLDFSLFMTLYITLDVCCPSSPQLQREWTLQQDGNDTLRKRIVVCINQAAAGQTQMSEWKII